MRRGKQQAGAAINPPYGLGGDPAAAAVILRIFGEFTEPYARPGLAEIAAGLNVDGIPTARGGQWHASTVGYVLRNPAYADLVGRDLFAAAQARRARLRRGPST